MPEVKICDVSLRDGMEKTYKWVYDAYLRQYGGKLGDAEITTPSP